ncbi:MAG: DUF1700 domain-containing protein [Clostridia bacterium]|nr:DUF1700 domain-containing protein [Clostridia bacterium]
MTKIEYLSAIKAKLNHLSPSEIDAYLSFYAEMIDDRIEEGMSEDEAVRDIGTVDEVVGQILSEKTDSPAKQSNKRGLSIGSILFLIITSPVWLPLLIAMAAVVFSVYVVLWSVIVSLYAVDLAVGVAGVAGVIGLIVLCAVGKPAAAMLLAGAGMICIGLSILMLFAFNAITKLTIWLSKVLFKGVKLAITGGKTK